MLTDTQWAILPARAQSIDMTARAFNEGNPAALNDIHWGNCSQYLLSELANTLLALRSAREAVVKLWHGVMEMEGICYCPVCDVHYLVNHNEGCWLEKVLGEAG